MPSGQAGAVKAVEAGGRGVAFACAGDSLDLSLSGVDTQVRPSAGCEAGCPPVLCFVTGALGACLAGGKQLPGEAAEQAEQLILQLQNTGYDVLLHQH
jgi:hypothetical protein